MNSILRARSAFSLCCGLALASTALSASDPPSPGVRVSGKKQHAEAGQPASNAAPDQRGTASAPLFVKGIPGEESANDAAHKEYEHHEKPTLDRWLTWSTVALSVSTFFLFFVTAALAVFTWKLWRSTGKLVISADENAAKQLRAYVWQKTSDEGITNFTNGGFVQKSDIRNSGQSPAYFVHQWSKMAAFAADTRKFESAPEVLPGPRFVVHPESEHVFHTPTEPMNSQQRDDIGFGNTVLFFWGELRYVDAFKQPHKTRFRLYWKLYYSQLPGPLQGQWVFCDEGNDAT